MQILMIRGFLVLLCTIGISFGQSEPINPRDPYTVCQIFENLDRYSGKIVQIRGVWRSAYMEGKCETQLKTGGHTWPNAIEVIGTYSLYVKGDGPVDWTFSPQDFNSAFNKMLQFKGDVFATIVGRLDVRTKVTPNPRGGPPDPSGYGPLGVFPARIVVKEIKDIIGSELRNKDEEYIFTPIK